MINQITIKWSQSHLSGYFKKLRQQQEINYKKLVVTSKQVKLNR